MYWAACCAGGAAILLNSENRLEITGSSSPAVLRLGGGSRAIIYSGLPPAGRAAPSIMRAREFHTNQSDIMFGDSMYLENVKEYVDDHKIVSCIVTTIRLLILFNMSGDIQMAEQKTGGSYKCSKAVSSPNQQYSEMSGKIPTGGKYFIDPECFMHMWRRIHLLWQPTVSVE